MGYDTSYDGVLFFDKDITIGALAEVKKYLGEDCRHHPKLGNPNLTYIDLRISDDFSGLEWDGSEKTYNMVEKINLIIENVKKEYPNFTLLGEFFCQGEEIDDRYKIIMEDGVAIKKEMIIVGKKVTCPHCNEEFILEGEE